MSNITLYKNFDINNLNTLAMAKNKAGGNQVPIAYNGSKMILIQTPVLSAPFGVSEYTPEGAPVKYSIDLSFKDNDTNSKTKCFLDRMNQLDQHMIKLGVDNSPQWFGKVMSREVVEELYRPLVKPSKQPEKYAPTIKLKIRPGRTVENIMNVKAFTSDQEEFDMSDFQAGSSIKAIVELAPIWFVNKQFGISMTIAQLEVVSQPIGRLNQFAFQDDDDDDI